jgi:hypothetical protein
LDAKTQEVENLREYKRKKEEMDASIRMQGGLNQANRPLKPHKIEEDELFDATAEVVDESMG